MASDSEDENIEDIDEDIEEDGDQEQEIEDNVADDVTEDGDEDSGSEDSDEGSDDDDEDGSEHFGDIPPEPSSLSTSSSQTLAQTTQTQTQIEPKSPPVPPSFTAPALQERTLTPAEIRRKALALSSGPNARVPRTFTVEAICALPHPVPTHALAASHCMSHLLTGSEDGYIRDYDIFTALNGKNFLTAPQRHHAGVVEGIMKAGHLRFWWENPLPRDPLNPSIDDGLAPVYSMAMHSDALWALAGTNTGNINLFTVRHDPGRLCHTINAHRGHVSALALDHDEKGFFSAGWDGDAIQWDLNTGQRVRTFTAHGAQLAALGVRPEHALYIPIPEPSETPVGQADSDPMDTDAKSEASFDPLFDDEPEEKTNAASNLNATRGGIAPPKNAPPLLDSLAYATFSPDMFLTAFIDGQVVLWDKRAFTPGKGVGRLWMSEKTPPWCLSACWSSEGTQIYAGRRNGTVDVWDVRQLGASGPTSTPRLLRLLRNPPSSGVVSCVVPFPDNKHIACASIDNLRLWNAAEAADPDNSAKVRSGVQFKIIPGHHGGYISQMLVDPGARFLVSASSNRGWHGDSTRTVFVHDVKHAY